MLYPFQEDVGKNQTDTNLFLQVTDSRPRIHLTVKLAPRKVKLSQLSSWAHFHISGGPFHFSTFQVGPGSWKFCDRNVDDVKDGYVSCQPFQDTRKWGLVRKMLRTKMSYKLANRLRKRRFSYYLLGQVILNRNSKALKAATVLASFLLAAPP